MIFIVYYQRIKEKYKGTEAHIVWLLYGEIKNVAIQKFV
jgi:hypothetical protein